MITYEGQCWGKTGYPTKRHAITRIYHQISSRRRSKSRTVGPCKLKLLPYRCPHCHQWHVGSAAR